MRAPETMARSGRTRTRTRTRTDALLAAFCAASVVFLVVRDLTVPEVRGVEVWLGFELRGPTALATAPLHWALFAFGAWMFWRAKPWAWRAAAAYLFYVAFSHLVWSEASPRGQGWRMGLAQAAAFSAVGVGLWRVGRAPGGASPKTTLTRLIALGAWILVAVAICAALLRLSDGPTLVFPGGPLRSGEPVVFDSVAWDELDGLRELELEVQRTRTSRLLWFSVYEGRPYFSCGFACDGGWPKRWPYQVDRDARVVLRIDGKRIEAQLERVAEGSPEYAAAYAARRRKFGGAEGGRESAERVAAESVVRMGKPLSEEPRGRLYRAVARPDSSGR
jgi:hypothetical protein